MNRLIKRCTPLFQVPNLLFEGCHSLMPDKKWDIWDIGVKIHEVADAGEIYFNCPDQHSSRFAPELCAEINLTSWCEYPWSELPNDSKTLGMYHHLGIAQVFYNGTWIICSYVRCGSRDESAQQVPGIYDHSAKWWEFYLPDKYSIWIWMTLETLAKYAESADLSMDK